jgi:hypothetical protein
MTTDEQLMIERWTTDLNKATLGARPVLLTGE